MTMVPDHASLARLEPHFGHQREVFGLGCQGQRFRLDAVLWPLDPGEWFDDAPRLGLEVKLPAKMAKVGAVTAAAHQAIDYAHATWGDFGALTIFHYPPLGQAGYVARKGGFRASGEGVPMLGSSA